MENVGKKAYEKFTNPCNLASHENSRERERGKEKRSGLKRRILLDPSLLPLPLQLLTKQKTKTKKLKTKIHFLFGVATLFDLRGRHVAIMTLIKFNLRK